MKRFLATILTLSLIFSLFAVPVSASTTAGEFDVDGNIVVLPHTIEVTLPTAAFSFIVDPEGVIEDQKAGAIYFTAGSPSFINRSSTSVMLGIEARITTTGTEGDTGSNVNADTNGDTLTAGDTRVIPVTDGDVGTQGDTIRKVYVTVTPSETNVATAGSGSFGDTENETALTTDPTLFRFVLPRANYSVTGTVAEDNLLRVLSELDPQLQGTQVKLAGEVTPNPEIWTGYEDFGVRVRFSFTSTIPSTVPGADLGSSVHLREIKRNTEVFDHVGPITPPGTNGNGSGPGTTEPEPEPKATAVMTQSGNVDVITITATDFTFPSGGLTLHATRHGQAAVIDLTTITPVVSQEGSVATITLVASWSTNGANQNTTNASWFEVRWGSGNSVRVNKPVSNVRSVDSNAVVTLSN